jgi:hypothetical protein
LRKWEDLGVLSSVLSCPSGFSSDVVVLVQRYEEVPLGSGRKVNSEDQIEYIQYELNLENKQNLEYYSK